MLIRVYGMYWNPDTVEWGSRGRGNRGELLGTVRIGHRKEEVNFWDVQGIYVLYDNFSPVYVGKADSRSLGPRLRDHLTDRFAGRWDMFSWFSVSSLRRKTIRTPGSRQIKPGTVINTLESLGILVTDPPLNRKRETIPSAKYSEQSKSQHPNTIRHYLEQILENTKHTTTNA